MWERAENGALGVPEPVVGYLGCDSLATSRPD